MSFPFYTVGHSTRSIEEFTELLQTAGVTLVVDIRHIPKSRTNPQYNEDQLPDNLSPYNIGYQLIEDLGGLRSKSKSIAPTVNGFWENKSFHNYADYALTDSFQAGLDQLIQLGEEHRCALMCSEAVWWRCHRRIVADHLLARGKDVFHLMGKDKIQPATLTKGARVEKDVVVYPEGENE
ncbi:DUF488 domain-containing protein [Marinobacter sp. 1-4A]|uniref:DUF488 domain-containing protein n=1 Tax=Marinobacter sp. 1-4A TaxID=2582919 RepID=UPI001908D506|nr:DUF488 domain-containing protein [Marinobacter sp. 1-4A]MBK1853324.1 DUF488 domain-containing protein [Marinobacter sp. 1-4A]